MSPAGLPSRSPVLFAFSPGPEGGEPVRGLLGARRDASRVPGAQDTAAQCLWGGRPHLGDTWLTSRLGITAWAANARSPCRGKPGSGWHFARVWPRPAWDLDPSLARLRPGRPALSRCPRRVPLFPRLPLPLLQIVPRVHLVSL